MSDWWLLQGVLVLMYLSECVRWVRPNCLVVEVRSGGSIRIRLPSYQLTLSGRLPVLLNPLTPWRANASAEVVPVCVSPSGIVAASCQELRPPPWPAEAPSATTWEEIEGIWSDGAAIRLGGQVQALAAGETVPSRPAVREGDHMEPDRPGVWSKRSRLAWFAPRQKTSQRFPGASAS